MLYFAVTVRSFCCSHGTVSLLVMSKTPRLSIPLYLVKAGMLSDPRAETRSFSRTAILKFGLSVETKG